ncbi:Pentatricopeptide repeat-containing protein [Seminavis robusta]|uniref:Pentatricopeptide repeat-containing protein n=1 Tax=Seminavis robusta TaxID=568900 RepID=A0A9N8EYE7_9STRA|nr:Pentatricopeptide repeat-containing protein [Seminavis robusta]|eukprot:Sro2482_g328890.1 Pentatricopeptide repeat-containing protein (490) ;mRNA; f:5515-7206
MSFSSKLWLLLAVLPVTGAYVTSHGAVPVKRQQKWLREMTTDICQQPPGELTEDMLQRTPHLMHAWSDARIGGGKESALALESLLVRLAEERSMGNDQAIASTEDYNCLLEVWAHSRSGIAAAERCEQILTEMEDRFKLGDNTVKPDLKSFKAVLMAWKLADGAKFAAVRAQRILEWTIRLASTGENEDVLPDADCFDIVLQLWSRSGLPDAPAKTEQLFATKMDSVKPRTASYNAVLAAWCKSKKGGATTRAYQILGFMEGRAQAGDVAAAPDEASYTAVVSSLLKSPGALSARRAEDILRQAEARIAPQAPDTILYNTVIGCWARCNKGKAYRKARSILDRQINNFEHGLKRSKPDVYGFTSVIASCSMEPGGSEERTKAFHVALGAFQQMNRYDKPNHVTYGTMLKADYLRHKWAKKIFRQSIRDGLVGDMVISRMRESVSPPIFRDLMQGHSRRNLPEAWFCNVHEKRKERAQGGNKKRRKRAEV